MSRDGSIDSNTPCPHKNKLKKALLKAKALGYILEVTKNKDNTYWTQPKYPLMIQVEQFKEKSNIYKENIYSHEVKEID